MESEHCSILNCYSYAADNPLINKDTNGRAVYLAARPVVAGRQHLYYYVAPESGSRFSATGPFTFGAGPQVPFLIGFGDLKTRIGYDSSNRDFDHGLSSASSYVQLTPEDDQSEDALILRLYRGHLAASKSDATYWFLGNKPGVNSANSNNYARTLAQFGGVLGQYNAFGRPTIPPS